MITQQLGVFHTDGAGHQDGVTALKSMFGFEPSGTNDYIALSEANVDPFVTTGSPMNPTHRNLWDRLVADLIASSDSTKFIVVGLEPTHFPDPFDYAATPNATAFTSALAAEFKKYQDRAAAAGKTLQVYVRYASEMNSFDPQKNVYGGDPHGFKESWAAVREIFQENCPDVP